MVSRGIRLSIEQRRGDIERYELRIRQETKKPDRGVTLVNTEEEWDAKSMV